MSPNAPEHIPSPDCDVGHAIDEFAHFPWAWVDATSCGVSRGGIVGGVDFNPGRPHIDFIFPNMKSIAWEIPEQFARMLDTHRAWGQQDIPGKIRKVLRQVESLLKGANDE